jgi:hypothetical protein
MAFPGPDGLPGTKPEKRHYRKSRRSKATTTMMDQQNFEAPRPVSADPAVALAEALGQLPKATVKTSLKASPRPPTPKAKIETRATVESLAQGHGLKLGDQNGLTIRRIKRGKGYSFIRANSAIRPIRPRICRPSASMPRAGCSTAIMPIGKRSASTARRIAWRGWSPPCRRSAATSRCTCRAMSRRGNLRSRP